MMCWLALLGSAADVSTWLVSTFAIFWHMHALPCSYRQNAWRQLLQRVCRCLRARPPT